MSGIAGVIHFDGKPVEPGLIEKMTSAMAHRGPDGIHHWVKGSVALGQCMLRTTPESLEEHQPLTNEDESLVLVMDGRVDNWEELRRELLGRGAVLRDRSDAELVLRAYEIWGHSCLSHIDGDFAMVIWDARRREAFCARDRMGNKPFNYHWNGKTFVFASELHTILALPWVSQILNEGMVAEFLAAEWYSRDETFWQGIMRLVAAHRMVVGASGPCLEQYWEPDLWATLPYTKDEEYIEHYRQLFADTVRRLSRSHKPVAYEVSGGLDSSAVFCMAEHLRRLGRLPAPGIEGYTLAFTDDSEADELEYARLVGKHLDVRIQEVSPAILPLSSYAECARVEREFPGFPNGSMFVDMRRQAASLGIRVMLSGEWGDAWLQGSRVYYAEALACWDLCTLFQSLAIDASLFGKRQTLYWLMRHGLFMILPPTFQELLHQLVRWIRKEGTRDTYWLSSEMQEAILLRRAANRTQYIKRIRTIGQVELLGFLYQALGIQVMERLERLSSSAGIEIRHPLGTPRFVQYAFSTPERLRLRGDRTKFIHVQAMQGIMPQAILKRKNKAVFDVVFRHHLDKMEKDFTGILPRQRSTWVTSDGMCKLFLVYQSDPHLGWPLWTLWGIFGCNKILI
ncbi:MAG: asparagine synthase (glutamine-hydrolyzing) [Candidatus Contendobacter sp.]|nr:asparagine synthase (glutamine-hydrolyzing) [Candidatus Contendobacter sp.]MDG4556942.1 asparagine synthase (glutamine-hydrolyzing) [Candidatus Contendobacter sp.]